MSTYPPTHAKLLHCAGYADVVLPGVKTGKKTGDKTRLADLEAGFEEDAKYQALLVKGGDSEEGRAAIAELVEFRKQNRRGARSSNKAAALDGLGTISRVGSQVSR